jgi:hypothetical protein
MERIDREWGRSVMVCINLIQSFRDEHTNLNCHFSSHHVSRPRILIAVCPSILCTIAWSFPNAP